MAASVAVTVIGDEMRIQNSSETGRGRGREINTKEENPVTPLKSIGNSSFSSPPPGSSSLSSSYSPFTSPSAPHLTPTRYQHLFLSSDEISSIQTSLLTLQSKQQISSLTSVESSLLSSYSAILFQHSSLTSLLSLHLRALRTCQIERQRVITLGETIATVEQERDLWKRKWERRHGTDSEESISPPQEEEIAEELELGRKEIGIQEEKEKSLEESKREEEEKKEVTPNPSRIHPHSSTSLGPSIFSPYFSLSSPSQLKFKPYRNEEKIQENNKAVSTGKKGKLLRFEIDENENEDEVDHTENDSTNHSFDHGGRVMDSIEEEVGEIEDDSFLEPLHSVRDQLKQSFYDLSLHSHYNNQFNEQQSYNKQETEEIEEVLNRSIETIEEECDKLNRNVEEWVELAVETVAVDEELTKELVEEKKRIEETAALVTPQRIRQSNKLSPLIEIPIPTSSAPLTPAPATPPPPSTFYPLLSRFQDAASYFTSRNKLLSVALQTINSLKSRTNTNIMLSPNHEQKNIPQSSSNPSSQLPSTDPLLPSTLNSSNLSATPTSSHSRHTSTELSILPAQEQEIQAKSIESLLKRVKDTQSKLNEAEEKLKLTQPHSTAANSNSNSSINSSTNSHPDPFHSHSVAELKEEKDRLQRIIAAYQKATEAAENELIRLEDAWLQFEAERVESRSWKIKYEEMKKEIVETQEKWIERDTQLLAADKEINELKQKLEVAKENEKMEEDFEVKGKKKEAIRAAAEDEFQTKLRQLREEYTTKLIAAETQVEEVNAEFDKEMAAVVKEKNTDRVVYEEKDKEYLLLRRKSEEEEVMLMDLTGQVEELESKLQQATKEIEELNRQFRVREVSHQKEKTSLELEVESAMAQAKSAMDTVALLEMKIEEMQTEIDSQKNIETNFEGAVGKAKEKLTSAEIEIFELQAELNSTTITASKQREEIQKLQATVVQLNAEIAGLKLEAEEVSRTVKRASGPFISPIIDHFESLSANKSENLHSQAGSRRLSETNDRKVDEPLNESSEEVKRLTAALGSVEREKLAAEEKGSQLQSLLEQLKEEAMSAISEKVSSQKESEEAIELLEQDINRLQELNESLGREKLEWQRTEEEYLQLIADLRNRLMIMESDNKGSQSEKVEWKEKALLKNDEIHRLTELITSLNENSKESAQIHRKDVELLQDELKKANLDFTASKKNQEELEKEIIQLGVQLEEKTQHLPGPNEEAQTEEINRLNQDLREVSKSRSKLLKDMSALEEKFQELEEKWLKEKELLLSRYSDLEREIAQKNEQLISLPKEMIQWKTKMLELETENKALAKELQSAKEINELNSIAAAKQHSDFNMRVEELEQLNEELVRTIKQLDESMKEQWKTDELRKKNEGVEVQRLENEIELMKAAVERKDKQVLTIEAEMRKKNEERAVIEEENRNLLKERATTEVKKQQTDLIISVNTDALRFQISNLSKERDIAQEKIEHLQQQIKRAEKQKLEQDNEQEKELRQLQERFQNLLLRKDERVQELEREIIRQQEKELALKEKEAEEDLDWIEEEEKLKMRVEGIIRVKDARIAEMEALVTQANTAEHKEQSRTTRTPASASTIRIKRQFSSPSLLDTDELHMKERIETALRSKDSRLNELEEECRTNQLQMEKLTEKLNEEEREVRKLSSHIRGLENEKSNWKREIEKGTELTAELTELRARVEVFHTQHKEDSNRIAQLQREIVLLKGEKDDMLQKVANDKMKSGKRERELIRECEEMRSLLIEHEEQYNSLHQTLKSKEAEWNYQLNSVRVNREKEREEMERMMRELFERREETMEREMELLIKKYEEEKKAKEKIQKQIKSIQEKITAEREAHSQIIATFHSHLASTSSILQQTKEKDLNPPLPLSLSSINDFSSLNSLMSSLLQHISRLKGENDEMREELGVLLHERSLMQEERLKQVRVTERLMSAWSESDRERQKERSQVYGKSKESNKEDEHLQNNRTERKTFLSKYPR